MLMKLLNLIILLFVPFLMMGVIKKTKAFWAGRKGVSLFQPLYDFIRLMKKDFVISRTTSVVFKIAPVVAISSVLAASLFVPMATGTYQYSGRYNNFCLCIRAWKILFAHIRNGHRQQF